MRKRFQPLSPACSTDSDSDDQCVTHTNGASDVLTPLSTDQSNDQSVLQSPNQPTFQSTDQTITFKLDNNETVNQSMHQSTLSQSTRVLHHQATEQSLDNENGCFHDGLSSLSNPHTTSSRQIECVNQSLNQSMCEPLVIALHVVDQTYHSIHHLIHQSIDQWPSINRSAKRSIKKSIKQLNQINNRLNNQLRISIFFFGVFYLLIFSLPTHVALMCLYISANQAIKQAITQFNRITQEEGLLGVLPFNQSTKQSINEFLLNRSINQLNDSFWKSKGTMTMIAFLVFSVPPEERKMLLQKLPPSYQKFLLRPGTVYLLPSSLRSLILGRSRIERLIDYPVERLIEQFDRELHQADDRVVEIDESNDQSSTEQSSSQTTAQSSILHSIRSSNQSLNQAFDQTAAQLNDEFENFNDLDDASAIDQSVNPFIHQSVGHILSQAISQVEHSSNHSASQLVSRSIDRLRPPPLISVSSSQSINQPNNQLVSQTVFSNNQSISKASPLADYRPKKPLTFGRLLNRTIASYTNSIIKSIAESTCQSVNQSVSHSLTKVIEQTSSQPITQFLAPFAVSLIGLRSINYVRSSRLIQQPINQSINQVLKRAINPWVIDGLFSAASAYFFMKINQSNPQSTSHSILSRLRLWLLLMINRMRSLNKPSKPVIVQSSEQSAERSYSQAVKQSVDYRMVLLIVGWMVYLIRGRSSLMRTLQSIN